MQPIKSVFGLVMAAIPVVYCLGFLLYFNGVRSSFGGLLDGALAPTMIGLGVIGLLFLIPLVLRIRKLVAAPAAPAAPRSGSGPRAEEAPREERSDFDPDAAIARYLAKQSSGASGPASPPAPHRIGGPARPTAGFGRRTA